MMLHHVLALALLGVQHAAGAYVQFKDCFDKDAARQEYFPESLAASIWSTASETQLELRVTGRYDDAASCQDADGSRTISHLEMAALGASRRYEGRLVNSTCPEYIRGLPYGRFTFAYDIDQLHPLDSFFLTIDLQGRNGTPMSCLNAPLTPDIGKAASEAFTWVPITIFFLVVTASLWRETSKLAVDQDDETESTNRESSHIHVTRVADCISYLQFIFFSSALSLRYPGFLQPVVSHASWSTLMMRAGVVARDPWYDGVQDGLYEINGTFGGTPGLELMTQVMGGTVTKNTFLNTIASAALVFMLLIGLVALGQRLSWSRDWFKETNSLVFRDSRHRNIKATVWTALRLFCSYLLMPLVTWSSYMLGHAAMHPVYYSVAATALDCCLVLFIWWAMAQTSPRSMGYLLIDSSAEYRNLRRQSYMQNLHTAGVFILLFSRGLIIGGLQKLGMVQLLVLIATEVIQISLDAVVYRAKPFSSRTGLMPLVRLVVLLLAVGFLPDVASHEARMALGYVILAIHALVLLAFFFFPALFEISRLTIGIATAGPSSQSREDYDQPQVSLKIFGM